ncbi:hypothetical protein EI94DRAFT_1700590 [Lactarius quietus]|nr:hypothetical protein EI94DRAFT_1700590 [Lactarius quietus]
MKDQYPSLPEGSGNLLAQVDDHPVHPTARSEAHNLWDPCFPDSLWWQYLAHVYSQETPPISSDAIDPGAAWPQSMNRPTARSPIHSMSQSLEKPPRTFAPASFDGSFGNQAGAIPDIHTRSGYDQDMYSSLNVSFWSKRSALHPPQEATFNRVGPETRTHILGSCALVKLHNISGEVLDYYLLPDNTRT